MTDTVREYVESLTDGDRVEMIQDYETLEKGVFLPNESTLRQHTWTFMNKIGIGPGATSRWMRDMVTECYRFYAMRHLRERGKL